MRKLFLTAAAITAAVAFFVTCLLPSAAFDPFAPDVANAMVAASYRLTPQAQLCSDFATWETRPARAHLERIAVDVFTVPWNTAGSKYGLGTDAFGLVSDVLSGNAAYVAKDKRYAAKDCAS